ncbi:MAG: hypothetical protein EHM28_07240 [Spirochaetaceae bacterium]|nr:MAG: hypothetical protein EHM28_07240 [Spirochaetaceae bacterium]
MSRYGEYWDYVSSAEKKARAAKAVKSLAKTRKLAPVSANTQDIASTWWGRSWIKNLVGYADYSSRLPRGRTYLRTGSVIDLVVESGRITALVTGSQADPYEVSITISPLITRTHNKLVEKCRKSITSLSALMAGEFPSDLEKSFLARGDGLFPSPREIRFDCTCPDWADMCKHVAASLYGTAVHLDERPELFFILRGMKVEDFVGTVIEEEAREVRKKAKVKTSRVLSKKDSKRLFGV